jgi:hypothetical protein
MTESELRARFEDLTLRADELSHAEHVRLAWTYLRELPLLDVLRVFPENLRRYAASIGAASIYHETVTWAFLMLIDERMDAAGAGDWEDFRTRNRDLFEKGMLERYYAPEVLQSERAKRRFVFPQAFCDPRTGAA